MEPLALAERDPMDHAEAARLSAWLAANGPDQWHYLAQRWNFDYGIHPLAWIVQQPDCDRATAQQIFLHLTDYLRMWDSATKAGRTPRVNDEVRLLDYVIARWKADDFPRSELESAKITREDVFGELLAIPYGFPASMVDPIDGRAVDPVPWGKSCRLGSRLRTNQAVLPPDPSHSSPGSPP